MVAWVWEQAMRAGADRVCIATDDVRIRDEMVGPRCRGADDKPSAYLRNGPVG